MKHLLPLLIFFATLLPAYAGQKADSESAMAKLGRAEAIIENLYVEEVDTDTLVTEAIRAMLRTLDPHSAYTTPKETEEYLQPLDGRFSGIGVTFNMLDDTVYVIQPTAGGPSMKAGILPGDRILAANDTVIAGKKMSNRKVMSILRGPKGSRVVLRIKRGSELIDFDIVRQDIPIYSVDETFMADDSTGYVRIQRFAEDTANEVARAIDKLRAQGMKTLVIDLSDNGGGYLGSAFELASLFLPDSTPVVATRGRRVPDQNFRTSGNAMFDGDVVVIMNQYSASASEIFAGAMQDNDRGVVVGRRSFGKGLVQRPFSFPDGSAIRLTIARYYTPSGRCIQKPYAKGKGEEYAHELLGRMTAGELWSADSIARPDSLRFETLHSHRPVYGGGGIIPDFFVPADTSYYSKYYRDLVAKGIVNRAVIAHVDANRAALIKNYDTPDDFINNYEIPESVYADIVARAQADGIDYDEDGWNRSRPIVAAVMKGLMCRDLFENGSYYRPIAPLNPDYTEALRVARDKALYRSMLQPIHSQTNTTP